jgi:hypothetical protein
MRDETPEPAPKPRVVWDLGVIGGSFDQTVAERFASSFAVDTSGLASSFGSIADTGAAVKALLGSMPTPTFVVPGLAESVAASSNSLFASGALDAIQGMKSSISATTLESVGNMKSSVNATALESLASIKPSIGTAALEAADRMKATLIGVDRIADTVASIKPVIDFPSLMPSLYVDDDYVSPMEEVNREMARSRAELRSAQIGTRDLLQRLIDQNEAIAAADQEHRDDERRRSVWLLRLTAFAVLLLIATLVVVLLPLLRS